jgi:hypothetical protein
MHSQDSHRTLTNVHLAPIDSDLGGFWRVATFSDGTTITHRLTPDGIYAQIESVHVVGEGR